MKIISIDFNNELKSWWSLLDFSRGKDREVKTFNVTLAEGEKITRKSSYSTIKSNQRLKKPVSLKNLARMISDSGIGLSRSNSFVIQSSNNSKNLSYRHPSPFSSVYSHNNDLEVYQHYILRTAFNGDYSSSVLSLSSRKKASIVLDIGCGFGTWTMEMATQFPNTHFIGMDSNSNFPNDIKPKNCDFKLFNINHNNVQLPFLDNSVDYIFQRDMNWDLPESTWIPLLQECYRILKPGGWIEIVEPDMVTHRASSQENAFINEVINAFYNKNQDPFVSKKMTTLMAMNGFRRVQSDFQSIPLGWGYKKSLQTRKNEAALNCVCSEYARAAACQRFDLWKSLRTWFICERNISRSKYEAFLSQLMNEWYNHKSYVNWHRSTAQKPY